MTRATIARPRLTGALQQTPSTTPAQQTVDIALVSTTTHAVGNDPPIVIDVIGERYEPQPTGPAPVQIGPDLGAGNPALPVPGGTGTPDSLGPGSTADDLLQIASGVTGTTPSGDPVAEPLTENCQRGPYIQDISVLEWPDGSLTISITPVDSVKRGGAIANIGNAGAVTAGADLGVESCVAELGGLDNLEFRSVYQQLECHVQCEAGFFLVSAGPTWDLESWRVPLEPGDQLGYARSGCLNTR